MSLRNSKMFLNWIWWFLAVFYQRKRVSVRQVGKLEEPHTVRICRLKCSGLVHELSCRSVTVVQAVETLLCQFFVLSCEKTIGRYLVRFVRKASSPHQEAPAVPSGMQSNTLSALA